MKGTVVLFHSIQIKFKGQCYRSKLCLQCFDAVGWAAGRASGLKKTEWWGAGVVICLQRGADLHMAQLMPLPLTVSCFSKIQIGFTFLVPAHLGSPGKRAVKRVCVCVCVCVCYVDLILQNCHTIQKAQNVFAIGEYRSKCKKNTRNIAISWRVSKLS